MLEDQSTGKRTIRTTSMCWGNKLSLLARPALFDPRLQADPLRPNLDFSQAVLEISDDEAWQRVRAPHLHLSPAQPVSLTERAACLCTHHTPPLYGSRLARSSLDDCAEEQDRQPAHPAESSKGVRQTGQGCDVMPITL